MGIKVIPCQPEHLEMIDIQDVQANETYDGVGDDVDSTSLAEWYITIMVDGDVTALFGVSPLRPGVGEACAEFTQEAVDRHGMLISKEAKRHLEAMTEKGGFRRVQCMVQDNFDAGIRWAEWLGFQREGLMPNAGYQGVGDYWMYGKYDDREVQ